VSERADRLIAPPVVGRFYIVPVVTTKWHHCIEPWPVIGPIHTDAEFFNFEAEHYHIDGRFLTARQIKMVENCAPWRSVPAELQAAPLHAGKDEVLPKPVLAKRRCSSSHVVYQHGDKVQIKELRSHYAGQQCERGKAGWVCPHRKASLGSVEVVGGIITCPLHGLQIDAATGVVISSHEEKSHG
jgi:nitrite reductase/ring-hydroxylating ferredoxin subunit